MADVAQTVMDVNPLFAPTSEAGPWHLRPQGIAVDIFRSLAYMSRAYALVVLFYELSAFVAVATFLSEPRYWPAYMGRWRDAYTVRRFWRSVWRRISALESDLTYIL